MQALSLKKVYNKEILFKNEINVVDIFFISCANIVLLEKALISINCEKTRIS